jgi:hypothetical protein
LLLNSLQLHLAQRPNPLATHCLYVLFFLSSKRSMKSKCSDLECPHSHNSSDIIVPFSCNYGCGFRIFPCRRTPFRNADIFAPRLLSIRLTIFCLPPFLLWGKTCFKDLANENGKTAFKPHFARAGFVWRGGCIDKIVKFSIREF